MALSEHSQNVLRQAIDGYAFPLGYFNFPENCPSAKVNTSDIEALIKADLTSDDPERVKNGLSKRSFLGLRSNGNSRCARSPIPRENNPVPATECVPVI